MALAAVLAAGAAGAQAAVMTLTSWTWGPGHAVSVSAPSYQGAAGGFSGVLSGSGVPGLDGAIQTYCVELGQSFAFNVAYADVSVAAAETVWGAARVSRLERLFSYVSDAGLFAATAAARRDEQSTALQLAVWNLVNDSDLSLARGDFQHVGSASGFVTATLASGGFLGANALLDKATGSAVTQRLWVLRSPTAQDQILWRPLALPAAELPGRVPEPGSLALTGLAVALVGAGRLARRRGA